MNFRMSRSLSIGTIALLAASLSPTAPVSAQSLSAYKDNPKLAITVIAPRARQTGRTEFGAPVETLTAQSIVYADDLNLKTEAGRNELNKRVAMAAEKACEWLDEVYPLSAPSSDYDCKSDAIGRAQPQVDAAIAGAS